MNMEMVFDPSVPNIDKNYFWRQDWSYLIYYFLGETLEEAFPPNIPKLLGNIFAVCTVVDADHAGKYLTRRSSTGFIILLNIAPIYRYTKKQS